MASYENGPQFKWPQTTEQNQEETNQIITNIKNVVTAFMNNQTDIPKTTTDGNFQSMSKHTPSILVNKVFTIDMNSTEDTTHSEMVHSNITSVTAATTTQLPETIVTPSDILNDIIKNTPADPLIQEMAGSNTSIITEMAQSNTTSPDILEMFNSSSTMDPVIKEMMGSNTTILTEMMGSNSTILTEMAGSNSTILTEMMGSNSTTLTEMAGSNTTILTEMAGSNSTSLTEMMGSNSTTLTEMVQGNNTMESGGGSILTQLGQDGTFVTSSEDATTSVSEMVTKAVTNATEAATEAFNYNNESSEKNLSMIEDKTLYIVVGTILVFLIILLVVLLIIYKRYKANGWSRSRSYHVANFSGVSVDSQKMCD